MRQLRAFAAIARSGSFTRASEQLHMTQPGLSTMVRDMERQLDCRLFERTTRAVALTPQGEAFLPVAARVLAELEAAATALGAINATAQHRLVLGATPVIASSVLPAACKLFEQLHPQIRVELHDLDRAQIHAGVLCGELDAGFGVFLDAASGLRRTPLLATRLLLVTAANEARAALHWSALQHGAPLLALPPTNPIQKLVDTQLRDAGLPVQPRQQFTQLHTVLAMVEAGAGRAVLPSFISAAAKRYQVGLRGLVRPTVNLDFYEITRAGTPRGALLSPFSRCLMETMRQHAAAALAPRSATKAATTRR